MFCREKGKSWSRRVRLTVTYLRDVFGRASKRVGHERDLIAIGSMVHILLDLVERGVGRLVDAQHF